MQFAPEGEVAFVRTANIVTVRVGDVAGVVYSEGNSAIGRIWYGGRSIGIGLP
jgi:hypothetical protein